MTSTALKAAFAPQKQPTPQDYIKAAYDRHGAGLVLSSSFGADAVVLLHMATQIAPDINVITVDTGYLVDKTYLYMEELTKKLKLNLHIYNPRMTAARQEALYGKRWEGTEEEKAAYRLDNKVEPMNRAMRELGATGWLSGLRGEQSERRRGLTHTEETPGGIIKYYPILDMTRPEIYYYRKKHDLPAHPLVELGYTSIGDWHETKIGEQRDECGLHKLDAAPRPNGDGSPDYVI